MTMGGRVTWLEETLHEEVPLTRYMGLRLEEQDDRKLVVHASLSSNVNIHGTAFGGSLFSICAIACWGALHLSFTRAGVPAHSVLGKASIEYARPVRGDFEACCELPGDGSFENFMERLGQGRRTPLELVAEVLENNRVAAIFRGTYSALVY
jgi:thioesterase domain-containing protein